jgi:hypothetical protein
MYRRMISCVMVGCVLLGVQSSMAATPAPTPQQIADRAIAAAQTRTDACVAAIDQVSQDAVTRIQALLNMGKKTEAKAAALHAVELINRHALECATDLRTLDARTALQILSAGGDVTLIQTVRDAIKADTSQVNDARKTAVGAVEAAIK